MFEPTEIIDDFLESSNFSELQNVFLGADIPWYYNKGINKPPSQNDLNDYQFTHKIFEDNIIHSEIFALTQPILNKLGVKGLIRVKANLSTKTDELSYFGIHTDTTFDCTTAIFYLNTNNGHTIVGEQKVESVENRLVRFGSQTPHMGSTATDAQVRVVLNFNYF